MYRCHFISSLKLPYSRIPSHTHTHTYTHTHTHTHIHRYTDTHKQKYPCQSQFLLRAKSAWNLFPFLGIGGFFSSVPATICALNYVEFHSP